MEKMFPTGKVEFDYPTLAEELEALEEYYKKINGIGQEHPTENVDEYEML